MVLFFLITLNKKKKMKIQNRAFLIIAMLVSASVLAQKPTEVPNPSDKPIDLSNPADIIIYIVLPLCAIVFFIIYKKQRNKKS